MEAGTAFESGKAFRAAQQSAGFALSEFAFPEGSERCLSSQPALGAAETQTKQNNSKVSGATRLRGGEAEPYPRAASAGS